MPASTRDSEQLADRLLDASLRHSYDPTLEIDWDAPFEPGRHWLPPARSSLYGTDLWRGLTSEQRVELTKHQVASAASAGIAFETILMQMLVRHYNRQDPTSHDAQYALTEIADECRHSVMFGRLIERLATPVYTPALLTSRIGMLLRNMVGGVRMFAAILIAEEVLDRFQREIAADESLQPLVRMVSRVHVVEEARHVRYAKAALRRAVADSRPAQLALARVSVGEAAYVIAKCLVHPRVYAAVGIDPGAGQAAARANPCWRATLRWSAEKVVATLDELGLIKGAGAALWRRSGLI